MVLKWKLSGGSCWKQARSASNNEFNGGKNILRVDPMMKGVKIRNDLRKNYLKEIGDLHETIYSVEYGFNEEFSGYVRETLKEFDRPLSDREKIWIVEKDERIMGCLAVVKHSEHVAQMRWFLVHPELRGNGIGTRMFKEAVEFIDECGYTSAFLYTQDILHTAAMVYRKFGFEIVKEKIEEMWGQKLVGQRYGRIFE